MELHRVQIAMGSDVVYPEIDGIDASKSSKSYRSYFVRAANVPFTDEINAATETSSFNSVVDYLNYYGQVEAGVSYVWKTWIAGFPRLHGDIVFKTVFGWATEDMMFEQIGPGELVEHSHRCPLAKTATPWHSKD